MLCILCMPEVQRHLLHKEVTQRFCKGCQPDSQTMLAFHVDPDAQPCVGQPPELCHAAANKAVRSSCESFEGAARSTVNLVSDARRSPCSPAEEAAEADMHRGSHSRIGSGHPSEEAAEAT